MPKTLPVHQVTWLPKLCAVRTIQFLSTILPLELWLMSACTVGDPTSENLVKKSGITFYPNKSKSKKEKFPGDGQLRLPISSTKWFRENRKIDLVQMALTRSKTILGCLISHGKTSKKRGWELHLFRRWRIILTRKISMKNGKTWKIQNSKRTWATSEEIVFKRFSMGTIMTTSWPPLLKTKRWSIREAWKKVASLMEQRLHQVLTMVSFKKVRAS